LLLLFIFFIFKSKIICGTSTIRTGGLDREGHPGKVKVRGAAGKPEKGWGQKFTIKN